MQNQNNQQRLSGYYRNLKIGAIVVISLAVIGLILGFWAGRSFTEMSQFVILGLVIGGGLLFFLWWVQKQPPVQSHAPARPVMWVVSFVIAAIWFWAAVQDWGQPHVTGQNDSMLRLIWIGGITVFFLLAWLKTRSSEKIAMMASWDPELKGRDERERSIILAATERTYVTGVFLLLLSAMVIFVVPSPSALAVSDLLLALSMLFAGLRNFYAWQMGLK